MLSLPFAFRQVRILRCGFQLVVTATSLAVGIDAIAAALSAGTTASSVLLRFPTLIAIGINFCLGLGLNLGVAGLDVVVQRDRLVVMPLAVNQFYYRYLTLHQLLLFQFLKILPS